MKIKLINFVKIYENKVFNVESHDVQINNKNKSIGVVKHKDVVAILPILNDGRFVMVNQYRYAIDKTILEIPAGIVEKNESLEEAAKRELQEEVGFYPNELNFFCDFYTSCGFSNERVFVYIAKDLQKSKLKADEDEIIEVIYYDRQSIQNLINKNKIEDAKTLITFLQYFYGNKKD